MKILIYGVGGIGGFLGSFLKKTDHDISFISRGNSLKKFKNNGLKLFSDIEDLHFKSINISEKISYNRSFDIVILAVKLYDFEKSINDIKDYIDDQTIILPFQNGIFAEEIIKKKKIVDNTFGAVAQISVFLDDAASVIHKGKLATFFIGNLNEKPLSTKLKEFLNDCKQVGLDVRYTKKITEKLWDKFIFLSAYSGLTTMTELSIGQIFKNFKYEKMFIEAMQETLLLSKKFGVRFDYNPVDIWREKITNMPYDMTSSMYLDFKNKKKLELNWLSGFVVKNLKKFGIESIIHEKIVSSIISK